MIKVFIVIGVIMFLLALALYLIFNNNNIEKFTIDEQDDEERFTISTQSPIPSPTPTTLNIQEQLAQLQIEIDKADKIVNKTPEQITYIQKARALLSSMSSSTPTPTPTPTSTSSPTTTENNIVDFLAVIIANKPWAIYYAGNFSDNKLYDILNNADRTAIATGIITQKTESGYGANGTIKSISGTTTSTVEWTANSIPEKFTICSITRYTGNTNNKRVLTSRNATNTNDWIHGHKGGKRGVVYYNEYKTNSSPDFNLTGNNTDWVVTCAKNEGEIPNNVYINGVPSGIKSGGQGGLKLSINKIDDTSIINEQSDFALSYVIIWDKILSDTAIKIVSNAFMNYLNTGEDLLFDLNNLTTDDKVKVSISTNNLTKEEIQEMKLNNDRVLLQSTAVTANPTSTTAPTTNNTSSLSDADRQQLYTRIANMESAIRGQTIGALVPTTNVINLNTQSDTTDKSCTVFPEMPEPIEASFTDIFDNTTLTNPIINNSKDSTYIWCNKCNLNNSKECETYDICHKFYNSNKTNFTNDYFNTSSSDKEMYNLCSIAFEKSFPKPK